MGGSAAVELSFETLLIMYIEKLSIVKLKYSGLNLQRGNNYFCGQHDTHSMELISQVKKTMNKNVNRGYAQYLVHSNQRHKRL